MLLIVHTAYTEGSTAAAEPTAQQEHDDCNDPCNRTKSCSYLCIPCLSAARASNLDRVRWPLRRVARMLYGVMILNDHLWWLWLHLLHLGLWAHWLLLWRHLRKHLWRCIWCFSHNDSILYVWLHLGVLVALCCRLSHHHRLALPWLTQHRLTLRWIHWLSVLICWWVLIRRWLTCHKWGSCLLRVSIHVLRIVINFLWKSLIDWLVIVRHFVNATSFPLHISLLL